MGHFSLYPLHPVKIFQEDFKDMNLDLLLHGCLFSASLPAKFEYYIQHFSATAINLNVFERDDVYMCDYGHKTLT